LKILDEVSDIGSDDYRNAAEEAAERQLCADQHRADVLKRFAEGH
jgi:hypothetical protein